jgi:methylthioribose-1-phosphate isomerase
MGQAIRDVDLLAFERGSHQARAAVVDGVREIPIEERSPAEVTHLTGPDEAGVLRRIQVSAPGSAAANHL